MTFEDFLHESQVGYSTIETRDDLHFVIQNTWNAAIKATIKHLENDDYYWPDDGEGFVTRPKDKAASPEVELRKLLTSK